MKDLRAGRTFCPRSISRTGKKRASKRERERETTSILWDGLTFALSDSGAGVAMVLWMIILIRSNMDVCQFSQ